MHTFIILALLVNLAISLILILKLKTDINDLNNYLDMVVGRTRTDFIQVKSSIRKLESSGFIHEDTFNALLKYLNLVIIVKEKEDRYEIIKLKDLKKTRNN